MFSAGVKFLFGCSVMVLTLMLLASISRADLPSPWQRVVVIGASASAGFVITEPFGGTNTLKCRLEYYLDAAVRTSHEPVRNYATAMLFLNPEGLAQQEVDSALKLKPTLVVGVDFLFWYCYGDGLNDEDRRQLFERGLKLLEQFQCPLIVGDIPDASYATNSGIIGASQVPSPTALKKANIRLKQWAAEHPKVTLVPLSHLMAEINARAPVTCHGQTLAVSEASPMIQEDHLHPTPRGAAWLSLEILDQFTTRGDQERTREVNWDFSNVYGAGLRLAGGK